MELNWYFFLVFVALLFCLKPKSYSVSFSFKLLSFVFFLATSLIVRTAFEVDIITYSEAFQNPGFYVGRTTEPIVWVGQRHLYKILESPFWVFVISDVIIGALMVVAFGILRVPHYTYVSMLSFFPFVLGMQNVYRQWVASILFLMALALCRIVGRRLPIMIWFGLSLLSHSMVAILLPLLASFHRTRFEVFVYGMSILIVPILLFLFVSGKAINTGAELSMLYVLTTAFVFFAFLFIDYAKIAKADFKDYLLIFTSIYVLVCSQLLVSNDVVERIGMMILLIIYPLICLKIDKRFRNPILPRVLVVVSGFFPLILTDTSELFLQN